MCTTVYCARNLIWYDTNGKPPSAAPRYKLLWARPRARTAQTCSTVALFNILYVIGEGVNNVLFFAVEVHIWRIVEREVALQLCASRTRNHSKSFSGGSGLFGIGCDVRACFILQLMFAGPSSSTRSINGVSVCRHLRGFNSFCLRGGQHYRSEPGTVRAAATCLLAWHPLWVRMMASSARVDCTGIGVDEVLGQVCLIINWRCSSLFSSYGNA